MNERKTSADLNSEIVTAEAKHREAQRAIVTAEAKHREAQRAIRDARDILRDAEYRFQQWRTDQDAAEKSCSQAQSKDERAQRTAHDARRRVREARQNKQPLHRFQADVRRYDGEARRTTQDLKRWSDEASRKSREMEFLVGDVKHRAQLLEGRLKAVRDWRANIDRLTRLENKVRAEEEAAKDTPLTVTDRAAEAIRGMLDMMEHDTGQALRLVADADGGIELALDSPREDDNLVSHDGLTFLLIETPLPDSLRGSTLDVDDTTEGTVIVLLHDALPNGDMAAGAGLTPVVPRPAPAAP